MKINLDDRFMTSDISSQLALKLRFFDNEHSLALPYITDNPIYLNIVLYKIRYQGQATKFPTYESPICDLGHFMGKPSRNGN